MIKLKEQFVTDANGKNAGVILDLETYRRLRELAEELTDVRAYDEAAPAVHAAMVAGDFDTLDEYRTKSRKKTMNREIDVLMLKLADGVRVLRLTEPVTGLALEKRLDPAKPVAQQTDHWKRAFLTFLQSEAESL